MMMHSVVTDRLCVNWHNSSSQNVRFQRHPAAPKKAKISGTFQLYSLVCTWLFAAVEIWKNNTFFWLYSFLPRHPQSLQSVSSLFDLNCRLTSFCFFAKLLNFMCMPAQFFRSPFLTVLFGIYQLCCNFIVPARLFCCFNSDLLNNLVMLF